MDNTDQNNPQNNQYALAAASLSQIQSAMQVSRQQQPGYSQIGVNGSGDSVFGDPKLSQSQDPTAGAGYASAYQNIYGSFGVLGADENAKIQNYSNLSGNQDLIGSLNQAHAQKDPEAFGNILASSVGDHTSLLAEPTYKGWGLLSPAQKSINVSSLGIHSDLNTMPMQKVPGTDNQMNVAQGVDLLSKGQNPYHLASNWNQFSNLSSMTGQKITPSNVAGTAQSLGLSNQGHAFKNAKENLQASATPRGVADANSSATASSVLQKLGIQGGQVSVSPTAANLTNLWGLGAGDGLRNGNASANTVVGGLTKLASTNPQLLNAAMGSSVLKNVTSNADSPDTSSVWNNFERAGLTQKGSLTQADGSTFSPDDLTDHPVANPSVLSPSHQGQTMMPGNKVDYTNGLDYVTNMGTTSLSRLINGGVSPEIDHGGNQLANSALTPVGYSKPMTQDNFNLVNQNVRGYYAQAGINNQNDAMGLAGQLYSEGRINETDLTGMQHSFSTVFGNNYNTARGITNGAEGATTANLSGTTTAQLPQEAQAPSTSTVNPSVLKSIMPTNNKSGSYGTLVSKGAGAMGAGSGDLGPFGGMANGVEDKLAQKWGLGKGGGDIANGVTDFYTGNYAQLAGDVINDAPTLFHDGVNDFKGAGKAISSGFKKIF